MKQQVLSVWPGVRHERTERCKQEVTWQAVPRAGEDPGVSGRYTELRQKKEALT